MLRFGQRRPHGFTLLEVLLALSLTVVLMGILTITIQVYLKASNAGRDEVEQAQLARVLLRRISDDLRSTIWHNEAEEAAASSTDSATSSASGGASSGSGSTSGSDATTSSGASSASGAGTGNSQPMGSSSSGGSNAGDSTSVSSSTELPPAVGLFGNQYEIQVDVSRLPRIEQYAAATSTATDIVSDVKTVAYFCQAGSTAAANSTPGLARREFDRAVTSYASTNGDLSAWESGLAPIAQEVTAIEFQYLDGTTWVNEWDSQDKKALPAAVKIALKLSSGAAPAETSFFSADDTPAAASAETIYYLTVFIPQSQAPKLAGASAMETMVSATANEAANAAAGGASAGGQSGQQPGGAQGGGSSGRGGGYGAGGAPGGDEGGGGGRGGGGGGGRGGGGGPDGGDGGGPPPDDDDDDDGGGG